MASTPEWPSPTSSSSTLYARSVDTISNTNTTLPTTTATSTPSTSTASLIEAKKNPPLAIPTNVTTALTAAGLQANTQGIVTWLPDSPSRPRNWPLLRKCYDSALICFLEFFMTLVSNTGSPCSGAARSTFTMNLDRETSMFCFITVYLLGQALGGLVFPPMAESFGGRTIYMLTTFLFGVCCLMIAVFPTLPTVVVARAISGLLSAMPATVACGSLENLWDARARITVIHLWISGAVLGLALGPVVATYISTSSLGWPFVYGLSAVVAFASTLACLLMRESRPSRVLHTKVRAIASRTSYLHLSTSHANALPTLREFAQTSLWQPIRLFFTEPIVATVSFMAASVYGVIYLFSEALSLVYVSGFNMSERDASLVLLALAVGIPLTFLPRIYDLRLANQITKSGKLIEPEDKLMGFYLAAPVLALGLWWFAATVPPLSPARTTPWLSIAALIPIGYGVVEFDNVLSGYLTDSYTSYAASANAPMGFLRAVLSGVFPLFGQQMFVGMGNNNALYLLAGLATAFCAVAVWFAAYGRTLRQRSLFAEKQGLGEIGLTESEASLVVQFQTGEPVGFV